MIKIQKCKRHGVCNDCGTQQSEDINIWEIRASITGQGWNTLMLCPDCMRSLHVVMADMLDQLDQKNQINENQIGKGE